jgi:hypothetical protein
MSGFKRGPTGRAYRPSSSTGEISRSTLLCDRRWVEAHLGRRRSPLGQFLMSSYSSVKARRFHIICASSKHHIKVVHHCSTQSLFCARHGRSSRRPQKNVVLEQAMHNNLLTSSTLLDFHFNNCTSPSRPNLTFRELCSVDPFSSPCNLRSISSMVDSVKFANLKRSRSLT